MTTHDNHIHELERRVNNLEFENGEMDVAILRLQGSIKELQQLAQASLPRHKDAADHMRIATITEAYQRISNELYQLRGDKSFQHKQSPNNIIQQYYVGYINAIDKALSIIERFTPSIIERSSTTNKENNQ